VNGIGLFCGVKNGENNGFTPREKVNFNFKFNIIYLRCWSAVRSIFVQEDIPMTGMRKGNLMGFLFIEN
jgi:hypothetical protein